jgi:predicted transcriptional regulator
MLESLITSKTRIKLLLKFFLNSTTTSYLRDLATEFGESTNAIRLELNHLEDAGLLNSKTEGNKRLFQANRKHPLFSDIRRLLLKHTGIDHVVENVVTNLGGLHSAYVTGSFARGHDNPVIELLLVGKDIDNAYLLHLVGKAEKIINRSIRYNIITSEEIAALREQNPEALLLWKQNEIQRQ